MCASSRVFKPVCAMKVTAGIFLCTSNRPSNRVRFEYEHKCLDPKDGELCLCRVNSGETLMEARSDTDVQIVRQTWV